MIEFLFFQLVLLPVPVLAVVLFVARCRQLLRRRSAGSRHAQVRGALRAGIRRPLGPAAILAAVATAMLTVVLERCYLATVADGPRWGVDVVLLAVVLALVAAAGCAALAGLVAAVVGRVRGSGAGMVAGLLAVGSVATGAAVAYLPLRMDYLADPSGYPGVANVAAGNLLLPVDVFFGALVLALPWSVLGAAFAAPAGTGPHRVRDTWQLLLDWGVADRTGGRSEWASALRAELAAIDPPAERRRFALGGVWAAQRSGLGRGAWLTVAGVGLAVAAGSFVASRWSLAHDRSGILGFWVAVPALLLLVVSLTAAWRSRSFGSGLGLGARAGFVALLAVLAVGVPEAVVWAERRAGYLTTGDAVPPTWQAAVVDVLRPEFLLVMVLYWTVGAATGAVVGAGLGRLRSARGVSAADPVHMAR